MGSSAVHFQHPAAPPGKRHRRHLTGKIGRSGCTRKVSTVLGLFASEMIAEAIVCNRQASALPALLPGQCYPLSCQTDTL